MRSQRNIDVGSGPLMPAENKGVLRKTQESLDWIDRYTDAVSLLVEGPVELIKGKLIDLWGGGTTGAPRKGVDVLLKWQLQTAAKCARALGNDPPSPDYAQPTTATVTPVPTVIVEDPLFPGSAQTASDVMRAGQSLVG